jgi:hypothetical protein
MDAIDLYNFYQKINKDKIIFCYCGPISQSTIEGIGQTLRLDLEIGEVGFTTTQSIFSTFIEQMQNILNYSADIKTKDNEADKELRSGVLLVGRENRGFFIYCGNKMYTKDVAMLRERIDLLSGMDKEQLKALYKERRKQTPDEGSKGAGIGLIEMARKAGKPLECLFTEIDGTFSFYSIKAIIEGNK